VEVVDPEQLDLHGSGARDGVGLVGPGVQAKQRYEKSGRKGGRSREQMTAVDASHGRKVCVICRPFVADSCRWREAPVKGYTRVMRVIDCDCGQTLQAGNDEDLAAQMRAHADEAHPELELSEEQAGQLVADRAYEASDS
jgi:hypothetical protein